jgi:hypothetical protein
MLEKHKTRQLLSQAKTAFSILSKGGEDIQSFCPKGQTVSNAKETRFVSSAQFTSFNFLPLSLIIQQLLLFGVRLLSEGARQMVTIGVFVKRSRLKHLRPQQCDCVAFWKVSE